MFYKTIEAHDAAENVLLAVIFLMLHIVIIKTRFFIWPSSSQDKYV